MFSFNNCWWKCVTRLSLYISNLMSILLRLKNESDQAWLVTKVFYRQKYQDYVLCCIEFSVLLWPCPRHGKGLMSWDRKIMLLYYNILKETYSFRSLIQALFLLGPHATGRPGPLTLCPPVTCRSSVSGHPVSRCWWHGHLALAWPEARPQCTDICKSAC